MDESKMTIASSSDVGKHGRMDAHFHIAINRHREKIAKMEAGWAGQKDALIRVLLGAPWEVKKGLTLIRTGNQARPFTEDDADRLIKAHPFVCGGLIKATISDARTRAEIGVSQAKVRIRDIDSFEKIL